MSPTSPTGVVDAAAPERTTTGARRRRGMRTLALVAALGAAVALTGCQVQNTPTGYDTPESGTIVRTNFIAACTGNLPSEAGTTTSIAPQNQCECIYGQIVANVPFDDNDRARIPGYPSDAPTFVSLENDLRTTPSDINKLPQNVQDKIRSCGAGSANVGPGGTGTTLG